MTSGWNCMKHGRWVDPRVLLVTVQLDLRNTFMIPHNHYFVQASTFIAFSKSLPKISKPINHSVAEASFTRGNLEWLGNSLRFVNLIGLQF